MRWCTAQALVLALSCLAADAGAAGAAADAALPSSGTTPQCSSAQLVGRGCAACNSAADTCSRCRSGFILRETTQCSKQVCCNQKPTVSQVRITRARLGESVAINLMRFVTDDQLAEVSVAVQRLDPSWGSGKLVAGADKSSRTFRFTPAGRTGVVLVRFYVRDPFKQAAQGLVRIRIYRNRAPVVSSASSRLPTVVAGVTAAYSTKDLLQFIKSKDPDNDALSIRSIALKTKGQGDTLQFHTPTKMWRYTCASGKPCVKGGNKLLFKVTDGLSGVAVELQQPVKPRPAFTLLAPLVLVGTESPDLIVASSEGQLTAAGFTAPLEIKVPQSDVMPQGELIEDNLLTAENATGVVDGVEFVPDKDQFAVPRGYRLPFTLGGTSRSQVLLAISSSKPTSSTAQASDTTNKPAAATAAAPVPPPDVAALGGHEEASAAASTGVPANSCKACIIDSAGSCISNVNSPGSCPLKCTLDPYTMYCYMDKDPRDKCTTCIIDSVGSCIDGGDGRCLASSCEVDSTGSRCIRIGSGDGDYVVPPETPDTSVNYAWLVPPVRTTSIGMWVSLGCNTKGTISVEFDLADSKDHDGVDSDGVNGDVDAIDPMLRDSGCSVNGECSC